MSDLSPSMPDDTSEQQFKRHDYYDDLMGGARRKPALPIGGPAVTRHLAFWCPRHLTLNRKAWVTTIEKYILTLYHHLHDRGLYPYTRSLIKGEESSLCLLDNKYSATRKARRKPSPVRNQATRYQTFRVRFYYGSMPVSVSFELHDEYFTLSTIVDLAWPADSRFRAKPNPNRADIACLKKAIRKFNKIATNHYEMAKEDRSEDEKPIHRRDFEESYSGIYVKIWDDLHRKIFEPPYRKLSEKNRRRLGSTFVDFRGFVITAGKSKFVGAPGSYHRKKSLQQRIGIKHFDAQDAVHRADALLPWLKSDMGFSQEGEEREADRTEPIEFTITQFLQKRALFATALGAQLSRRIGQQGPMTFVVLAANQARWQQGRLIDRIHMLGTLRLAALYDLTRLIEADAKLRDLEDRIDKADKEPKRLPDMLRGWRQEFTDIEQGQIAGGLPYRVERSGYYQRQFDEHLDGFRSSRIEGFPPYKEAVNRRLAGDYELIRSVGEHDSRLEETLAALSRRVLAIRTNKLQQDIEKATKQILALHREIKAQTDNSVKVLAHIDNLQGHVNEQSHKSTTVLTAIMGFQSAAETGFFLVLFPYYTSSVVMHFFAEEFLQKHLPVKWIILVVALTIGVGFAFRKKLSETRLGQYTVKFVTKSAPVHLRQGLKKLRDSRNRAVQKNLGRWQFP